MSHLKRRATSNNMIIILGIPTSAASLPLTKACLLSCTWVLSSMLPIRCSHISRVISDPRSSLICSLNSFIPKSFSWRTCSDLSATCRLVSNFAVTFFSRFLMSLRTLPINSSKYFSSSTVALLEVSDLPK